MLPTNTATFAKRPGFSALSAVRSHHVIGVNDSVASQWGPHTIEEFVSQMAIGLALLNVLTTETRWRKRRTSSTSKRPDRRASTRRGCGPLMSPWGLAFFLVAAMASILVGPADLAPGAVLAEVAGKLPLLHIHSDLSDTGAIVVWQLRMPRMVLGGLVGAMLAVAGASYQGVFSNPLADPYLLGIASGAGLGATLVIVEGPVIGPLPADALPVAAFAGGWWRWPPLSPSAGPGRPGARPASMLLAGVAVAAFFTAVQTFLLQQSSPGDLSVVYTWILGGLATAGWGQVLTVLPYIGVAIVVLVAARRCSTCWPWVTKRQPAWACGPAASGWSLSWPPPSGRRRRCR